MTRAFLFPGQGAQYVGMGKDFFEAFEVARHTFEEADDILGRHLSRLIFEGPSGELTLTKNAQVAIYVMSMAVYRTVREQCPDLTPTLCAGLSLGEYTALTASGYAKFEDCLPIVAQRGALMHEASTKYPGTMAVVLGMEEEVIRGALGGLDCVVANLNCPGQVVISGSLDGVAKGSEILKGKGARKVLPLDVSGAFHSPLMQEAGAGLAESLKTLPLQESSVRFVMNTVGEEVSDLEAIRKNLLDQVTQPVYWEKGVRSMGAEEFVEIGCGKTLSGMNRKMKLPCMNIGKVEDLDVVCAR